MIRGNKESQTIEDIALQQSVSDPPPMRSLVRMREESMQLRKRERKNKINK